MKSYLLFRLYGPLASWGDIAVGTHRPSYDHPSKSAVMGLLAAAVGIRRDEENKHRELAEAYNFAVLVNSPGVFLRDYHTAQIPSVSSIKKQKHIDTRKGELGVEKEKLTAVLSSRDYYSDSLYTIAICSKEEHSEAFPYPLELLEKKLNEPEFVLYLGRKSCPLALPVEAKIIDCNGLKEAFDKVEFKCEPLLRLLKKQKQARLYWEGEENGLIPIHTIMRRDLTLSRKRWQFADRKEHYMMLELGE
ncbi:type I-E CRISPR-associated protein Cas5/CasD [Methanosarcina sp. WWM596]|uniref:type I-E CRISPR-associated protein Cas5/CasD n=1 Tax=Methanosarcina sp. WWM596 TaxID=1434103 RepID=UPI000615D345|nr:type I-E CRISPR-associated protein Cas5/CasD [Methanosarcina sp. WWM596]AKB19754.1 CRISPR-associated protein, Cas5e family [Methanosarcina sp. WWM596]